MLTCTSHILQVILRGYPENEECRNPSMKEKENRKPKKVIDREKVRQIAKLAQIDISPHEEQKLEKDLNHILGYFERLDSIPTEGIEPLNHTLDVSNVFRDDRVGICLPLEKSLENAPDTEDQQFRVPSIIE